MTGNQPLSGARAGIVAYLDFVIEALVEKADAETQVFAVFLLLSEQLSLAVIAESRALTPEALLHLALMWIHAGADQSCVRLDASQSCDIKCP